MMFSSAVSMAITLVVVSVLGKTFTNAQTINGQTLAEKWALDKPITTFDQQTNTLTLTFDVDESITDANIVASIWEKGCLEEGNELFPSNGIDGATTAIKAPGQATLSFSLNTQLLKDNSDIFTAYPSENKAEMVLCARFILQTAMGQIELNWIENIITVIFDLTAGFVTSINVDKKEDPNDDSKLFEKGYGVDAYLCDPNFPEIPLVSNVFLQGSIISVCVTPDAKSRADGLLLESIDSFEWSRGMIEQPAVVAKLASSNSLTSLTCAPGSLYCSLSSMLYADFYRPPTGAPSDSPTQMPSQQPSTSRISEGTSASDVSGYDSSDVTTCNSEVQVIQSTLDFENAVVKQMTLDQPGGELRFGSILEDPNIDLVIRSSDYTISNSAGTGKSSSGKFGEIWVRGNPNDPAAGSGTFDFCFVQSDTYNEVMINSFQWSVFDIDSPDDTRGEKMYFNTNQAVGYTVYPNQAESAVKISCEDGMKPPCAQDVRTIFDAAYADGSSGDPDDPNNLSIDQMRRSVVFTFEDTACWRMTYMEFCRVAKCPPGNGSNFLFSGVATQVAQEGSISCSESTTAYPARKRRMRELQTFTMSAEVGGIGTTTLSFSRRRGLSKTSSGRTLQGDTSKADIEMIVTVATADEGFGELRTAGGSLVRGTAIGLYSCIVAVGAIFLL